MLLGQQLVTIPGPSKIFFYLWINAVHYQTNCRLFYCRKYWKSYCSLCNCQVLGMAFRQSQSRAGHSNGQKACLQTNRSFLVLQAHSSYKVDKVSKNKEVDSFVNALLNDNLPDVQIQQQYYL